MRAFASTPALPGWQTQPTEGISAQSRSDRRPGRLIFSDARHQQPPHLHFQHITQTNGVERGCKTTRDKEALSESHIVGRCLDFYFAETSLALFWQKSSDVIGRTAGLGWASPVAEAARMNRWHFCGGIQFGDRRGERNKRALVLCPDLLGGKGKGGEKKRKEIHCCKGRTDSHA